jgi:CMP/dCMP kinase
MRYRPFVSPGIDRNHNKVSIAGHVGSGKSEVARRVSAATGWPLISTGALFRDIASGRGLSVLELNQYAESHPEVDDEVDGRLRSIAASDDPVVLDSRMAWHFVPSSVKVYLVVDPNIAAQRVFGASRSDEAYPSIDEAARDSRARQRVEGERYHRLYGVDRDDWRNYDLVVDTSHATPSQVAALVVDVLRRVGAMPRAGSNPGDPECWLSPRRLIPTASDPEEGPGLPVGVAVHGDEYLIVTGHDSVSSALSAAEPFVECRLLALGDEEVAPGVQVAELARVSPELKRAWEESHGFRFADP